MKGPLLEGIVGLILGRSSLALQGVSVIPGVIDSDYTGELQVLNGSPFKNNPDDGGTKNCSIAFTTLSSHGTDPLNLREVLEALALVTWLFGYRK